MKKRIDMTGERYGRLVATKFISPHKHGGSLWECRCDCGNIVKVRSIYLRTGHTSSCGCLMLEKLLEANLIHGMAGTSEYHSWKELRARCNRPTHKQYKDYGGRGIRVCKRWEKFENFLADMGTKPSPKHSIDRFPGNNGNYEPKNCRWATMTEQANNTRKNRMLTLRGIELTVAQWERKLGLTRKKIEGRLRRGWTAERTLSTP